jgi:hypothetical protein
MYLENKNPTLRVKGKTIKRLAIWGLNATNPSSRICFFTTKLYTKKYITQSEMVLMAPQAK